MPVSRPLCLLLTLVAIIGASGMVGADAEYDVLIVGGHVVDGTGDPRYEADVAIQGDRIVAIGKLSHARAKLVLSAKNWVVSPGFIDMLGQSEHSLLIDNRSLSKLSQGITSEITGEGSTIAPVNDAILRAWKPMLDRYHLTVDWRDLAGYFRRLEKSGTPLNIGTYVGAAQVRQAVMGEVDRRPTSAELEKMKALVDQAMRQGALGVSSALIYPPGFYSKTDELIELAKVSGRHGGIYATHIRSEGEDEMAALEEAIRIGRQAGVPVEIFHLKVSGKKRWGTMPKVVGKIQQARDSGLDIAANVYPYVAGSLPLAFLLPPWVGEGGTDRLLDRLRDRRVRKRLAAEISSSHAGWENLYSDDGGGTGILIAATTDPALRKYNGRTLAEVAQEQGKPELEALFDLVLDDKAQTQVIDFYGSEEDLRVALKQPWTSLCLDGGEASLDGPLYEPHTHPRDWGAMPRFLGHYSRDLHLVSLEDAVRKVTSWPARRAHLVDRGRLRPGFYADVTIFDPTEIGDRATYLEPAQLSTGVKYVLVNGQLVYENGKLTGAMPGRALRRKP